MISDEINIICFCCLILLFYFSYQILYGNPNIFEGFKKNKKLKEEDEEELYY